MERNITHLSAATMFSEGTLKTAFKRLTEKSNESSIQQAKDEYLSYYNRPIEFLEKYFYGIELNSNHSFKQLDMQVFERKTLKAMFNEKLVVVTKSRQMFCTTMIVKFLLYNLVFEKNKSIMVVCHNRLAAESKKAMLLAAISNLPTTFKEHIIFGKDTRTEIRDAFNNKIKFVTPTTDIGCGESLDVLIVDEYAYLDNFMNIHMAGSVCIKPNGQYILISSLNPYSKEFRKFYKGVNSPSFHGTHIKLHWSHNSYYNQGLGTNSDGILSSPWYNNQCEMINNESNIKNELDCILWPEESEEESKQKSNKEKIITFRINKKLEEQLTKLIVKKTLEENISFNVSDYIRELIEKDIKNHL